MSSKSAAAYYHFGEIYRIRKRLHKAIKYYEEAIYLKPKSDDEAMNACLELGKINELSGISLMNFHY
ncbi:MAG: tetratricopeptide repeat protein [Cyanobacteriota bacterium]